MPDAPSPLSRLLWWHALKALPRATGCHAKRRWKVITGALLLGLLGALALRAVEHPWQEEHLVLAPGTAAHILASYASWWGKLENGAGVLLVGWLTVSIVGRRRLGQVGFSTVLWAQIVGGFLVNLGKSGLGRARPNRGLEDVFTGPTLDYAYQSFPSGHTTAAFTLAATLAAFFPRWGWTLFLFAGMVGWSRLALHVHHPSDVLMGAVLGTACGWICGRAGAELKDPGATLRPRSTRNCPSPDR